ncbi:hypothetical protein VCHA50P420_160145 [Vibrio chagasii]|nr:hypothetical protein VCHA50P420_160145 [Vibrio chagasii]
MISIKWAGLKFRELPINHIVVDIVVTKFLVTAATKLVSMAMVPATKEEVYISVLDVVDLRFSMWTVFVLLQFHSEILFHMFQPN